MESNQTNNDLFNVSESVLSSSPSLPKAPKKLHKQQISLTINPDLLDKVDAFAAKLGQSRASIINLALYRTISQGLAVTGLSENP